MKNILYLFLIPWMAQAQVKPAENHYLSFPDAKALHAYFRYQPDMQPIVSGHRGTIANNCPENSIAAFEFVLSQAQTMFEIDPRLTKDSVIVVFHDATMERTSTGKGKVIDHTWAELQQLHLKDQAGNVTEYKIPTLDEILEWARDKTILVLDKKDVPLPMIADMIRKHHADRYVINMVRSTEDARFYYDDSPDRMFSVSIRTPETFEAYVKAGIPCSQMFACTGIEIKAENQELFHLLHCHGICCLIAAATNYDRLPTEEERATAYRSILVSGADIIESNYPLEVVKQVKNQRQVVAGTQFFLP
ncbi:MAG: glycerophosphodiester phosphodiesterase family protein [Dysgonamonadaceae bacterium]|jgi:glycerophosphoryl diester phosphodiesterase|nr:glycerophosphodiester phosphodiesterase family protein [Dysgonamonadaceae bacterium]